MSDEETVTEEQQDEAVESAEEVTEEPAEEAEAAAEEGAAEAEEAAAPEPEPEPEEVEEERDPLSRPRVIPLDTLLRPIPGEVPSGEYLRYHGIYDEISEARRADDIIDQGDWQTDFKTADYRQVIQLAVPVLEKETKDLQLAAWLVEAIVAENGFAGLRDGLKLLSSFIMKFWDTIYPSADDGDEEGRANALAWVDRETAMLIQKAPITIDGWGYNGYLDSKTFDIPVNLEGLPTEEQQKFTALKERVERENRCTAAKWEQAIAKTNRAFCEEVNVAFLECQEEYNKLNEAVEAKFDRNQAPSLPELRKIFEQIRVQHVALLEMKRAEEPDPADEVEGEEGGEGTGAGRGAAGVSGPIGSRADALKRLTEIAAYFRRTEPHSPVSYLVNRAIQWGNMPLDSWLQDVIKDQNILAQIKQTLGFNTVSDSGGQAAPEQPAPPPPPPPPNEAPQ